MDSAESSLSDIMTFLESTPATGLKSKGKLKGETTATSEETVKGTVIFGSLLTPGKVNLVQAECSIDLNLIDQAARDAPQWVVKTKGVAIFLTS